jgi:HAD superfamily hydrolase (TIGR01662 family)
MHAREPWEPITDRADLALVEHLSAHGYDLPRGFAAAFRQRLARVHQEREQNLIETTYLSVLREMLVEHRSGDFDENLVRSALDALYAVTQENWKLEDDAHLTLKMLESAGYRLGMVSNAGDDKDVRVLAERFGIQGYFDFILTSASCGYRKPHPRIFELALANWDFPATEVAMVGDTLEADVLGANKAGIYSIWITRRVRNALRTRWRFLLFNLVYRIWVASGAHIPNYKGSFAPDARLQDLIEIPTLLNKLKQG